MFLAVFEASVESQEHDANQPTPTKFSEKDTWSTLQTICHSAPLIRLAFYRPAPQKSSFDRACWESWARARATYRHHRDMIDADHGGTLGSELRQSHHSRAV